LVTKSDSETRRAGIDFHVIFQYILMIIRQLVINIYGEDILFNAFYNNQMCRSGVDLSGKKELPESTLRRLVYIRRLYLLALQHIESGTWADLGLAILSFDNAIEALLQTILEYNNVRRGEKISFPKLLEVTTSAISKMGLHAEDILDQVAILGLHTARNGVQHHGHIPHPDDVQRFRTITEGVLEKVLGKVFGTSLSEVSLATLIKNDIVREFYVNSETAFYSGDYRSALINVVAAFETAKNLEQLSIYGSGISLFRGMKISGEEPQKLLEYIEKLDEEVEILKLRLDYKKYQKYRELFPNLEPFTSVLESKNRSSLELVLDSNKILSNIEGLIGSASIFKHEETLKEHAKFCLDFAIENILKWESLPRCILERVAAAIQEAFKTSKRSMESLPNAHGSKDSPQPGS
jgi:hypothetical protein